MAEVERRWFREILGGEDLLMSDVVRLIAPRQRSWPARSQAM